MNKLLRKILSAPARQVSLVVLLAPFMLVYANQGLAQSAIVRAVLFYSPSCPHCQQVIQQDLPPLLEKYGAQLSILGVNVSDQVGQELYRGAIEKYHIPQERIGVPCLIVGDTILVGSKEIPENFPGIVESGLESGGIAWPELPGLSEVLAAEGLEPPDVTTPLPSELSAENPAAVDRSAAPIEQTTQLTNPPESQVGPLARFNQDRIGNGLAVIVLIGLILSVLLTSYQVIQLQLFSTRPWPNWIFPILILIGLGVASYLSYIETTQQNAVCGPIGDCNSVQQSPYARLFGVLPIGVLGAIGYLSLAAAWLIQAYGRSRWQPYGTLVVWGLALFGTLFSIYLTFLEPFVIGATCAWCLTSALVMALLLWAATNPAINAWKEI